MRDADLLTLQDYAEAYRAGLTTPQRAMREVFRRIDAHNDPAIFITLRARDEVMQEAQRLESADRASLPLYGIPVAVKDNIDVAGMPTTAACPDFLYRPAQDATAVKKLREAGAIIIGKTNLDQFATGLVGVRSPYGVPRNVLDARLIPGGSSSGSAVAVAAGIVPLALGTDTAGSGRVPAGLNNIVGLKPSLGAISTTGVVPACRTLDCISIFALTVDDAWSAYRALAGFDTSDAYSRPFIVKNIDALPPALRIGIPDEASLSIGGDTTAATAFASSVATLTAADRAVQNVDMQPFFETANLLYDGPWIAERYQAVRALIDSNPEAMLPVTRQIIGRGMAMTAADAFAGQYRLAELRRAVEKVWTTIDVLVVPTFPRVRSLADLENDPLAPNRELGTYTNFVNLLDLCALAVPATLSKERLPSGITLLAPAGKDALLAAIGRSFHGRSRLTMGGTQRRVPDAPIHPEQDSKSGIELAVVGAHMSGMPLNHELVTLGARFMRKCKTAPDYGLYALPGGPPFRPGLLRVGANSGHAIEIEVWSLEPAAFGKFVAGIPSPLGIGTLRLADGSSPKGFVVESAAVDGAQNISRYGGWRAFIMEMSA